MDDRLPQFYSAHHLGYHRAGSLQRSRPLRWVEISHTRAESESVSRDENLFEAQRTAVRKPMRLAYHV
jgi:hypothetical protein